MGAAVGGVGSTGNGFSMTTTATNTGHTVKVVQKDRHLKSWNRTKRH